MPNFNELFADALEIEITDFDDNSVLTEIDEWDSMAALSVIAFAAQSYGKSVTGDQLEICVTVSDVKALIT